MPDQKTKAWLEKAHEMGLSDMEIQNHLKKAGWDHTDINRLLVKGYTSLSDDEGQKGHLKISESSLLGIRELLSSAWNTIKKSRRQFIATTLIFAAAGVILYGLNIVLLGSASFGFGLFGRDATTGTQLASTMSSIGFTLFTSILFGAIGSFLFAWMQATYITILTEHTDDKTIRELLRVSFKKIIPFWLISILIMFHVGGASFLMLLPGIVFAVWFSFSFFIHATDKTSGMLALLKSKEYVRGIWWPVFGRYAALYGLFMIVFFVITTGATILSSVFIALNGNAALALGFGLLSMIIITIIATAFVPFALAYTYILFRSVKEFKKNSEINPFMSSKGGLIATAVSGWIAVPITSIIIIGLTSSLYGDLTAESRNATRQADIYTIRNALELYYEDSEAYPQRLSTLTAGYIEFLPTDPDTYESYTYQINAQQGTYTICASLELTDTTYEQIFCLDQDGNNSMND